MPVHNRDVLVEVTINDDGVHKIVKGNVVEWLPYGVVFFIDCSIFPYSTYQLKFRNVDIERAQSFASFDPKSAQSVDIETKVVVERVSPVPGDSSLCIVQAKYRGNIRILSHSRAR